MWNDQSLCDLLDTEHPIIQAPMAGASTVAMAAAAANAGALGSLGCAMLTPNQVKSEILELQNKTSGSININFFVHEPPDETKGLTAELSDKLSSWYHQQDAGTLPKAVATSFPFDQEMYSLICDLQPKVASFHFGLPDDEIIKQLKSAGIIILSTATSVKEAKYLEQKGADAIIAQGYEAGGHSGWFLARGKANLTSTMALLPRAVDAVSVPVIAAGGIADGRGIAAALMLGAAGVQIGTAFLASPESSISDVHKKSLMAASGDDTMLSKAFSGRSARTIVNSYAAAMEQITTWPDFPIMNTLTGPLRKASALREKPDAIALWSGQAAGLIKEIDTASLINNLVEETFELLNHNTRKVSKNAKKSLKTLGPN